MHFDETLVYIYIISILSLLLDFLMTFISWTLLIAESPGNIYSLFSCYKKIDKHKLIISRCFRLIYVSHICIELIVSHAKLKNGKKYTSLQLYRDESLSNRFLPVFFSQFLRKSTSSFSSFRLITSIAKKSLNWIFLSVTLPLCVLSYNNIRSQSNAKHLQTSFVVSRALALCAKVSYQSSTSSCAAARVFSSSARAKMGVAQNWFSMAKKETKKKKNLECTPCAI